MGGRGGITEKVVENSVVALGDNLYQTSVINVGAEATIKKGVVLYRLDGGFAPVTDTETQTPVAVNPFDIFNPGAAPVNMSIRALVSGPVRADLLTINGEAITDDQSDMLRNYGIIPEKTNDLSRVE